MSDRRENQGPSPGAIPDHLNGAEAHGLVTGETIAQFQIGDYRNLVYLIIDWQTREAACVDPQSEVEPIELALSEHRLALTHILFTHSHWDHIAGVPELARRHPDAQIMGSEAEFHRLTAATQKSPRLKPLTDGQALCVGRIPTKVIFAPGHSAGELCFWVRPYLITGDTIFIRDCGNTSSPTGNNAEMFETLQKIKKLPPDTIILPGHHYFKGKTASLLEEELRQSPPFLCKTVEELAALP